MSVQSPTKLKKMPSDEVLRSTKKQREEDFPEPERQRNFLEDTKERLRAFNEQNLQTAEGASAS